MSKKKAKKRYSTPVNTVVQSALKVGATYWMVDEERWEACSFPVIEVVIIASGSTKYAVPLQHGSIAPRWYVEKGDEDWLPPIIRKLHYPTAVVFENPKVYPTMKHACNAALARWEDELETDYDDKRDILSQLRDET